MTSPAWPLKDHKRAMLADGILHNPKAIPLASIAIRILCLDGFCSRFHSISSQGHHVCAFRRSCRSSSSYRHHSLGDHSRSLHPPWQILSASQGSLCLRRVAVAWPSLSDPCTSVTSIALASPKDQGLCGHLFTSGNNPNFTAVEVQECQTLPSISPIKKGASRSQLCIALTPNNVTCPGAEGKFEVDYLCGGPLTTG